MSRPYVTTFYSPLGTVDGVVNSPTHFSVQFAAAPARSRWDTWLISDMLEAGFGHR